MSPTPAERLREIAAAAERVFPVTPMNAEVRLLLTLACTHLREYAAELEGQPVRVGGPRSVAASDLIEEHESTKAALSASRAEVERLREALRAYGNHETECLSLPEGECECGWSECKVELGLAPQPPPSAEGDALVDEIACVAESDAPELAERVRRQVRRADGAERAFEEADKERERYSDALIEAHRALGGDGEWCAKPGQTCVAGSTGDLAIDVPALAEEVAAQLAAATARAEKAELELRDTRNASDNYYAWLKNANEKLSACESRERRDALAKAALHGAPAEANDIVRELERRYPHLRDDPWPSLSERILRLGRALQGAATTVECENCMFRYGAEHVASGKTPESECPCCSEARLEQVAARALLDRRPVDRSEDSTDPEGFDEIASYELRDLDLAGNPTKGAIHES